MKYLCMIYFDEKELEALTDSPFAETKEQLGGFVFTEARNLDVAAKIPGLRIGCVEIRPVAYFDMGNRP